MARRTALSCLTKSVAVAIAARPDASLWLIVTFGPRSLNSRPARLAAALPTVLLKSSAGAATGPPRKSACRYSLVACPPAVHVPSTTPVSSSPSGRGRVPGVAHRLAGDHDGEDTGAIHPAQLHRRDPLRRLEAGDRRREARAAIVGRERGHRGDAARSAEQCVPECLLSTNRMRRRRRGPRRRTWRCTARTLPSKQMKGQHSRAARTSAARCSLLLLVVMSATVAAQRASPAQAKTDLFDEIYQRGRGIDSTLKTLTARFTETTTSSLLTRPLVARGTLAVDPAGPRCSSLRRSRTARRPHRWRPDDTVVAGAAAQSGHRHRHGAAPRAEVFRRRDAGRSEDGVRHRGRRRHASVPAHTTLRWCRSESRSGRPREPRFVDRSNVAAADGDADDVPQRRHQADGASKTWCRTHRSMPSSFR